MPMLDVYKSFYNFKEQPFRLSPDCSFCYSHPSYANAKSYLQYAVLEGEGFVAITGEPGTGKTTLIGSLLAELDKTRVQVATLTNVQIDSANLLNMVLEEFELQTDNQNQTNPLSTLKKFLIEQYKNDRRCILIVDEAQGLSITSLEELRLISNLQYNNRLLLQVFLVGQQPLMDIIRAPGLEQLHQRIIAASHLESLGLEETMAYVIHRLRKAGWNNDPVLPDETMRLVYKFSGGVPRRINLICHRLFLYGGLKQKHELIGADALHVIVELYKENLLMPEIGKELSNYVGNVKPHPVKIDAAR
ncbi:MAG: AAA family ATPase [Gammaproteobacteria bacterium]|nr:AAA family ATPase [Gammaproteobacteria bacterium]